MNIQTCNGSVSTRSLDVSCGGCYTLDVIKTTVFKTDVFNMRFYGREDEIALLRKFRDKSRRNAQLVVLTGRRLIR